MEYENRSDAILVVVPQIHGPNMLVQKVTRCLAYSCRGPLCIVVAKRVRSRIRCLGLVRIDGNDSTSVRMLGLVCILFGPKHYI